MGPSMQQNPSCAMLQLPVEMILPIFEHLCVYERIILAHTCSSLRAIFINNYSSSHNRHPLSSNHLSSGQRSRFLFTLAYRQPDRWVCYRCMQIHRVNRLDTPVLQVSTYNYCRWPIHFNASFGHGDYELHYWHAQLALKYTRLLQEEGNGGAVLQREYQEYLDSLMKPHVSAMQPSQHALKGGEIRGRLAVLPKIVDGQLLVQTVRVYKRHTKDVSVETIGCLLVCPHLLLYTRQQLRDEARARMLQGPRGVLELGFRQSFEEGVAKFGSCSYCETDFMVEASSKRTVVRSWHNLGSEAPMPDNLSWKWGTVMAQDSLGFYSQPLSILDLYKRDSV